MTLISEHGEVAVRRLGALQGFYQRSRRSLATRSILRLGRSATDAQGSERVLLELTIVRIVSIIEAFALDLGEATVQTRLSAASSSPADTNHLIEYLKKEKWSSLNTGSWDRLVGVWKNGLSVQFSQFSDHEEVELLRQSRHAIAHRVGEYTEKYRRVAHARLIALGIDPAKAEGLIPLTASDVEEAFALARSFVGWLDPQVAAAVNAST